MRKRIKINYETQYIHGIKIVCKDWVPKDIVMTITSPDENGLQQVVLQKVEQTKK